MFARVCITKCLLFSPFSRLQHPSLSLNVLLSLFFCSLKWKKKEKKFNVRDLCAFTPLLRGVFLSFFLFFVGGVVCRILRGGSGCTKIPLGGKNYVKVRLMFGISCCKQDVIRFFSPGYFHFFFKNTRLFFWLGFLKGCEYFSSL